MREASYLGWRNYWIEAAFWDIRGKVEGKPVWALLGGKEAGRAPVYASTGEVHPPEQRAEEVLQLREMGFKTVKLRVHSFDPPRTWPRWKRCAAPWATAWRLAWTPTRAGAWR